MSKNNNYQFDKIFNEIKEIDLRDKKKFENREDENTFLFQPGFVSLLKNKFSSGNNIHLSKEYNEFNVRNIKNNNVIINEEIPCKNLVSDTRRVFEYIVPKGIQSFVDNEIKTDINLPIKLKVNDKFKKDVDEKTEENNHSKKLYFYAKDANKTQEIDSNEAYLANFPKKSIVKCNHNKNNEGNINNITKLEKDNENKKDMPVNLEIISDYYPKWHKSEVTDLSVQEISNNDIDKGSFFSQNQEKSIAVPFITTTNFKKQKSITSASKSFIFNARDFQKKVVIIDRFSNEFNEIKCLDFDNSNNKHLTPNLNNMDTVYNKNNEVRKNSKSNNLEFIDINKISENCLEPKSILKDNNKNTKIIRSIRFANNDELLTIHVYESEDLFSAEEDFTSLIHDITNTTENLEPDDCTFSLSTNVKKINSASIYNDGVAEDIMDFKSDMLF